VVDCLDVSGTNIVAASSLQGGEEAHDVPVFAGSDHRMRTILCLP
jgi:hypothetical protein